MVARRHALAYLLEDGVYVRELESGKTRRLGVSSGLAPHWSPDSRNVAWISDRVGRLAVAAVSKGRLAQYKTHTPSG